MILRVGKSREGIISIQKTAVNKQRLTQVDSSLVSEQWKPVNEPRLTSIVDILRVTNHVRGRAACVHACLLFNFAQSSFQRRFTGVKVAFGKNPVTAGMLQHQHLTRR